MLIQTCSLSLAKSFMREALQGLAVICFVCKILHLFMDLSCNSRTRARRGLFVFHFNRLGVGPFIQSFSSFPQNKNGQDDINTSCSCALLLSHLKGQIWGRNQPEGCHGGFSRTGLGAKLCLRCDSSGLQSGKACCRHSCCITWTVTMLPSPAGRHEDQDLESECELLQMLGEGKQARQ